MVANCIDLFVNGNLAPGISAAGVFDGIDIDWEFPTTAGTVNATLLLQEFRKQLDALGNANKKHYLLTMFGPAGQQNLSNLQLAEVAPARLFQHAGLRLPRHSGDFPPIYMRAVGPAFQVPTKACINPPPAQLRLLRCGSKLRTSARAFLGA
jgi:hypothetical protein